MREIMFNPLNEKVMKIDFKMIDNVEVGDIDMRDYPDFTDAFIEYADYNGKPMTDEMIEFINDNHHDFVQEYVHDNQLYL